MKPFIASIWLLAILTPALASEPLPAPSQRFALPLSDGTTTQAVFLPAPGDSMHLVYATSSGQLVFLNVMKTEPGPDPIPPDPIPPATSVLVAIVHDPVNSSAQQRQIMADRTWRDAIKAPNQFCGIIPSDYIDANTGTTPEEQDRFLRAARGAALPCLVMLNEKSEIVLCIPLPETAEEILKHVKKYGDTKHGDTNNRRVKLSPSNRPTHRPANSAQYRRGAGMLAT